MLSFISTRSTDRDAIADKICKETAPGLVASRHLRFYFPSFTTPIILGDVANNKHVCLFGLILVASKKVTLLKYLTQ